MNRNNILALSAVAILVAGGAFLAGRASVGSDPTATPDREPVAISSSRASAPTSGDSAAARPGLSKSGAVRSADNEGRLAKLEEIVRSSDPLERNRALLAFLDKLNPAELKDAVARFRSLGITESRFGEYSMLLTAWAKADPVSALEYAKTETGGDFATNTILSAWAGRDPDAALRWADANFDGEDGNPYLVGIIEGIAGTDPTRATQLLASMPYSSERGEALTALLPFILAQGGEATREWAASIQDDQLREGVINRVVEQLAQKQPKETADWLLTNPTQESVRQLDDALAAWTEQDQPGAIAYYNALPAGEARSSALRGIVNTMATSDPKAAAAFMDSHSADTNDQVVQQFVWHSSQADPALAASYIGKITNPREQENLYNRMLTGWLRRDLAGATTWIQSNTLPQSVQNRVQRTMLQLQSRQ
jgi:hypothetical protein